jgi:hypothetical protein
LRGTFPPARRASDNPIAMACFRLFTVFPDRPLFKVPLFRSRIARLTFWDAFLPYLAIRFSFSLTTVQKFNGSTEPRFSRWRVAPLN